MLGAVMLPFSIFRAAMFAEPTVTKIEEVVRLVHGVPIKQDRLTVVLVTQRVRWGRPEDQLQIAPTFLSVRSLPNLLIG